jgi:branched-chain amino acid transport system ATP-binding protein
MAMDILDVRNLSIQFGGLKAVNRFDLVLGQGELVGLIGPNGAGKTTVFNLLTGVYTPTAGNMFYTDAAGKTWSLASMKAWRIARLGITRTFQNIRLFKRMSVIDNVRVSFHSTVKYRSISAILRLPSYWREEARIESEAMELLKIFKLDSKRDELAGSLPYGEQRKLEIARAMAAKPRVLLLDDDMSLVMKICERILVLDYGEMIAQGLPEEIKNNPQVIQAYLGEEVKI